MKFSIFLAMVLYSLTLQQTHVIISGQPTSTINMWYLGTVDGKSFFANSNRTTFQVAEQFCLSQNLEVAEIRNDREYDLLNSAYDEKNFYYWYWTSARDRRTHQQFVWGSGLDVSASAFGREAYHAAGNIDRTCLTFYSRPGVSVGFMLSCKTTDGGALCQTTSNNSN